VQDRQVEWYMVVYGEVKPYRMGDQQECWHGYVCP
jgi:hypothetical protein